METRRLGKTEHQSSVVAFGTYAIGKVSQEEADRAIEWALDQDINHFDVAPTYAEAELRLGSYLKRHPQPDLFISCKTNERGRAEAREELHRTLDRLGRDRFDLYQFHAVRTAEDLEAVFAANGAFDGVVAARDEGLVGHIGITGHGMDGPATHAAALRRFDFSTVMMACNALLYEIPSFRRDWEELLDLCRANDVGIQVLKVTAKAPWRDRERTHNTWYEPMTKQEDIDRAVAWALAQPVTTLCTAGDLTVLPKIVSAAARYRDTSVPPTPELVASVSDYGNIFPDRPRPLTSTRAG